MCLQSVRSKYFVMFTKKAIMYHDRNPTNMIRQHYVDDVSNDTIMTPSGLLGINERKNASRIFF